MSAKRSQLQLKPKHNYSSSPPPLFELIYDADRRISGATGEKIKRWFLDGSKTEGLTGWNYQWPPTPQNPQPLEPTPGKVIQVYKVNNPPECVRQFYKIRDDDAIAAQDKPTDNNEKANVKLSTYEWRGIGCPPCSAWSSQQFAKFVARNKSAPPRYPKMKPQSKFHHDQPSCHPFQYAASIPAARGQHRNLVYTAKYVRRAASFCASDSIGINSIFLVETLPGRQYKNTDIRQIDGQFQDKHDSETDMMNECGRSTQSVYYDPHRVRPAVNECEHLLSFSLILQTALHSLYVYPFLIFYSIGKTLEGFLLVLSEFLSTSWSSGYKHTSQVLVVHFAPTSPSWQSGNSCL